MEIDTVVWQKRIKSAQARREKYKTKWNQYAVLHAKAYSVAAGLNDDEGIVLPSGDMVALSLVHRNIEQTMAVLETPEIGIRVKCLDTVQREEGFSDLHQESIIEQGLVNSSRQSGLLTGVECADQAKRDGVLFGHGIIYSSWRIEHSERETGQAMKLEQDGQGEYKPVLDEESGEPMMEALTEQVMCFEGVQDEHVPVLEFLFESTAKTIAGARWHGREQVVLLNDLKVDDNYDIPDDVKPSAYRQQDIYGVDAEPEEIADEEWVKLITVWDKPSKMLLSFLDAPGRDESRKAGECPLLLIRSVHWPVTFSHPDDSPFTAFVPIPANDLPFGVSQIEHIRNSSVEGDKVRTRQANIARQQKRIGVYDLNYIDENKWDAMIQSPDMSFVGVHLQDGIKLSDVLSELPIPSINADLYQQAALAEKTVRDTSGISDIPMGGAQTATETEAMTAVGNARANRKQRILLDWFASILSRHKDFIAEFGPSGQVATVPDEMGLPIKIPYGREAFQGRFDVKVLPSGGAFGLSPVQQKTMLEFSGSLQGKFGPAFDRAWLSVMLKIFDVPDAARLVATIPIVPAVPPVQQQSPPIGQPTLAAPHLPGQQAAFNPNNYTPQQAVREGVNAPME